MDKLMELIDRRIDQKLKDAQIMKYETGAITVDNGDGTFDVRLTGDTISITNLINKTGQALIVTDNVFIFKLGSLTNSYIGAKFGI